MADETYNGWANRMTWNVALWIDNKESLYRERFAQGECREWTAERAESFVREIFQSGTPDMDSSAELDAVDWNELACNWNEEH